MRSPRPSSRFAFVWLVTALFVRAAPAQETSAVYPAGLTLAEAIRLALDHDANIDLSRSQVDVALGALLATSGQFDPVVRQTLTAGEEAQAGSRDPRTLVSSSSVSQTLRSGLTLTPSVNLTRTDDGSPGSEPVNDATVTFALRQPLLRGRGRAAVAAGETAARHEVAAAEHDLRHTAALRILTVASQYFTARAARSSLDILRADEERSRNLLGTTERLIEADITPAAERVQVEANLVANESSRLSGERALFEARQTLGREIGLELEEITALPLPSDPFPLLAPEAVLPAEASAAPWALLARSRRGDLAAARERQAGAEALLEAAENALLPQLDLVVTPSYTGQDEGESPYRFFTPLARNVPGLASSVSLALTLPVGNRRALGDRIQNEAFVRQAALSLGLLSRQIDADVAIALHDVGRLAEQLERSRLAVRLFAQAVTNEEKKLQAGTSTILDLLSQRDRLTAARQNEVSAGLALALALLRLRFETGTLIRPTGSTGEELAVDTAGLLTLPTPSEVSR